MDTWATVGSGAQIGADGILRGGVGIGGSARAAGAAPRHRRGRMRSRLKGDSDGRYSVGARAVLGPNVSLTSSITIIDVTGNEPVEHRGFVPPRAIVVPGRGPRTFLPAYHLRCARSLAGAANRPMKVS